MTLNDYLRHLGWSRADLARAAGLDKNTVTRAVRGEPVWARTAQKIAAALGQALGKKLFPGDIEGLHIT